MNNIFLIEVFRKNKFLFLFFCFFIAGQIFFSTIRIQNFPFFTFDMYSRPVEHRGGNTQILHVYINGEKKSTSDLSQYKQATLFGGFDFFHFLNQGNEDRWKSASLKNLSFIPLEKNSIFNKSENLDAQAIWLKMFLSKVYNQEIETLKVERVRYRLQSPTELEIKSRETIYSYHP